MFGWCIDNHHTKCPKTFKSFYFGPVRKGRKMVEGIIFKDDVTCSCYCHDPNRRKTRKKTTPRRKK